MKFLLWLPFAILALFFAAAANAADDRVCPNVVIRGGGIDLDANERTLVCGNEDSPEAWREVPLPQAQYHLNVFLQNRGYLNARFQREGDTLVVDPGPITRTTSIRILGADGILDARKKRKIVGHPVEPQKLDELKRWAEAELRRRGYACPELRVWSRAWEGEMMLRAKPGGVRRIDRIERRGFEKLDPEVSRRFEAFEHGGRYSVLETQITRDRLLSHGLFQSALVNAHCPDASEGPASETVDLIVTAEPGRPRILRFGLGASTEELPFGDVWYRSARLDDLASSFTLTLHGSPIRQSFTGSSELFVIPGSKRSFLGPRFKVERRDERSFVASKIEVGGDLGRAWDDYGARFEGLVGPTFNRAATHEGLGPPNATYLSWEGSLTAMSHEYEAFLRQQYEGWTGSFEYNGLREGLASDFSVDRYDLRFKHLWNLGRRSPPLFVFSSRFEVSVVDPHRSDSSEALNELPVDLRIFYGGDENLRGFSRHSLDNRGRGYLTAALGGFEIRLIEELPAHLEPFLLFDVGVLGEKRTSFDGPVYSSSGLGIRWPSPFGSVRGSAAKGRIWNKNESSDQYPEKWVFFVSFGQEF